MLIKNMPFMNNNNSSKLV